MSIPPTLSVFSEPTNLFTIKCKVLSNPEDGIGVTSELGLTEFLVQTAGESAKTKTTFEPRIGPAECLIVVDLLSREGSITQVCINFRLWTITSAFSIRALKKSDVDSTQTNMESNLCLDLDLSVHGGVGFVLGPDALGVRLPSVGKVSDHKDRSYPQCHKYSNCRP